MDWGTLWISIATFAVVFSLAGALIWLFARPNKQISNRLNELSENHDLRSLSSEQPARTGTWQERVSEGLAWVARLLLPNDDEKRQRGKQRMIEAGFYAPAALTYFYVIRVATAVFLVAVTALLTYVEILPPRFALLAAVLGVSAGLLGPNLWLWQRSERRKRLLYRSLSDYLDLMVACMESGMSLQGAIQRVSDELALVHPLLAGEMQVVQREIELGARPDEALRHLGERANLEVVRTLATFVEQARKLGTTLSDAMRIQAENLRIMREQRAEEMAQKAAVKLLVPMLIFIFPAIFVVVAGPAAFRIDETFSQSSKPAAAESSRSGAGR